MKKAPIAVALVLVFGLFAAAFSLAPAVAQQTPPTNATSTGNATSTANATSTNTTTTSTNATTGETFSARGSIATLIFDTGETTTTSETQNDTTTASNDTSMTGNMTTSGNTTTATGNDTTMTMPQIVTGDNGTSSSNMTDMGSNMTGTESNMTSASNETSTAEELKPPYIVAGDWDLDVQDGSVSDFAANFTMVHTDGTGRHAHEMSNFVSSDSSTIDTSGEGSSFIFGTVDVATNGETAWTAADALIIIEKNNVVSISLATEDTEDHFAGQPIYGIVESMTDEDGNEMIDTGTEAADDATGNITQGIEDGANETGGFFGNVTEGIEDLFNNTG